MTTEDIDCDAPLRLNEAAKIAFPCGGMTAAGLRREAKRGTFDRTAYQREYMHQWRAKPRPKHD
jgi:hypothetical protein